MSENKPYTQEELQLIATAAIASTATGDGMTEAQWERAVIRRATTIQRLRMFMPGGPLMSVLESVRLRSRIIAVDYEESTSRYIITYQVLGGDGDEVQAPEKIRTPRTDSPYGKTMLPDIEKLKACAETNRQVIIFKYNEMPTEKQIAEARKTGKPIPTKGYRQAAWFEFLD